MYNQMKKRREELGLSLQQLADRTGISKATLQRYETGVTKKIPQDSYEKICRVLEIGTDGDISALLEESLARLDSDCALMFDGKALDDRTRELLLISLRNSIEMARSVSEQRRNRKK